jgi:putative tryptophan/tyrosine transport system substrate-binding protein
MRRRDFIKVIVGSVAAWPSTALAQQPNIMRRIGVLTNLPESDPEAQSRNAAFLERMRQLGWRDGGNLRIEFRYALGAAEDTRKYADELVALGPDAILAVGTEATAALRQATPTVPIVFVLVPDPVGAGFVNTLAHPGGNITGFTPFEYNIAAKWIELLKGIAPAVTRVAVLRDSAMREIGQFATIQAVAPSLHLEATPLAAHSPSDIEHVISAFANSPNGGLIVPGSAMAAVYHGQIVALAAQNKLPAVYFQRFFVAAGGLTSYGPDFVEQYRRAAGYIDRILKGENPGDLPVQVPTKFELVINLKTARTLGLSVPPTLLATADEVIE